MSAPIRRHLCPAQAGRHFAGKTLANITPKECQGYVAWRTSQPIAAAKDKATAKRVATGTARRELEVLSAAVGHAYREGRINYRVAVWLPDKPPARDRYLSKSELARLLWAAWRNPRAKHLVRFILIGLYSSTRHEAILRLQWMPNLQGGWVDLEQRLIHRKGDRQTETNKRRPPVGISRRLGAHLERWRRAPQGQHVVEYDGQPIRSIRRALRPPELPPASGPTLCRTPYGTHSRAGRCSAALPSPRSPRRSAPPRRWSGGSMATFIPSTPAPPWSWFLGAFLGAGKSVMRLSDCFDWWAVLGSNQRPLRCQRSALPLS